MNRSIIVAGGDRKERVQGEWTSDSGLSWRDIFRSIESQRDL